VTKLFTVTCKWTGCEAVFQTPFAGRKYCDEHQEDRVARASVKLVAHVRQVIIEYPEGRTFQVKDIRPRLVGSSAQALGRVLSLLVEEGLISVVDPSVKVPRYRVNRSTKCVT
jgi:hypothetical protein